MNKRQVKQLETELARIAADPAWQHKLLVVGQKRRTTLRWWVYGKVVKAQCWYWWHLGRLQAKLNRVN